MRSGLVALLVLSLPVGGARAQAPAAPAETAALPVTLLVDLGAGQVLTARQPDLSFVPASVTKVMTVYVAFEAIAEDRLTLDRRFAVRPETARRWNGRGTSLNVAAGQEIAVDTLLHGIATVSANDAAVVLAEGYAGDLSAWSRLMNDAAVRLGMVNSHFASPNGWPDGGKTYVSARDLAKLAQALVTRYPTLYNRYFGQKYMTWKGRTLTSRDPTIGVVSGADGIKTGFTREAGYNFLGSASRDGRRLVMVVAGAKSEAQRASASRALLEWGFAAWRARPLFAAGKAVAEAQVQGGDARSVPLVATAPVYAAVPRGKEEPIAIDVVYEGPIAAPIAKGARIAKLRIRVGDIAAGEVPLYAGRSVGKAGNFDRIINGFVRMFS